MIPTPAESPVATQDYQPASGFNELPNGQQVSVSDGGSVHIAQHNDRVFAVCLVRKHPPHTFGRAIRSCARHADGPNRFPQSKGICPKSLDDECPGEKRGHPLPVNGGFCFFGPREAALYDQHSHQYQEFHPRHSLWLRSKVCLTAICLHGFRPPSGAASFQTRMLHKRCSGIVTR